MYISVNRRDNNKVVKELQHYLLDHPDTAVAGMQSKLASLAALKQNALESKWLFDYGETMIEKMPAKYTGSELEDEIAYSKTPQILEQEDKFINLPSIKESMNLLFETIEDDLEHIKSLVDQDAKSGYKTADTAFFGCKTHLAIDNNRLITAAVVTTGEKADGYYLPELVEKLQANGVKSKQFWEKRLFLVKRILLIRKRKE